MEPVFLVGSPRSGTTWLQGMIAAHPEVYSGPETHFFRLFAPLDDDYRRARDRHFGFPRYLDAPAFDDYLRAAFWGLVSALPEPRPEPRYFLEKTPDHGRHAPLILRLFPNARFIHLVRDGRSVAASLLRGASGWASDWAPSTLTDAVYFWQDNVRACRAIRDLVPTPSQYLELRYEDLRAEPQGGLAAVFAWIGLEADEAAVRSIVEACSLERARETEGRCPSIPNAAPLPDGFIGDGAADGNRCGLPRAKRLLAEDLVGDLLRELGYSTILVPEAPAPTTPEPTAAAPGASVLVVAEGDDPGPVLETLSAMAPTWGDHWELCLIARSGTAGAAAAGFLEGNFRLLDCPGGASWSDALNLGARAAAPEVIVPTERGLLSIPRERLLAAGGVRGFDRSEAIAWLARHAQPLAL